MSRQWSWGVNIFQLKKMPEKKDEFQRYATDNWRNVDSCKILRWLVKNWMPWREGIFGGLALP